VGVAVRYARSALRDIDGIHRHIVAENPAAAERVRKSILRTIDMLRDFPFLGKPGRRSGTREMTVPKLPYLIVYRAGENQIAVLRVYHGAQKRA